VIGPDFDHFCRLAHERSGLVLGAGKAYLVQARLDSVARSAGFPDVAQLLAALRSDAPQALVQRCVDAMATHESMFFRDTSPFEQIAKVVLPELSRSRPEGKALRIWCAACSSGQEPYSLAILIHELGGLLGGRRVEIVGTDMSEVILQKARAGIYSEFEVKRGLSPERLNRWLQPQGSSWEVSKALKAMVSFQKHNLLDGVGGLGVFDIVLCRNVLIYFDAPGKAQVLEQIARAIAPDGALFLGSAETVIGLTNSFIPPIGRSGFYRPSAANVAPAAKSA